MDMYISNKSWESEYLNREFQESNVFPRSSSTEGNLRTKTMPYQLKSPPVPVALHCQTNAVLWM